MWLLTAQRQQRIKAPEADTLNTMINPLKSAYRYSQTRSYFISSPCARESLGTRNNLAEIPPLAAWCGSCFLGDRGASVDRRVRSTTCKEDVGSLPSMRPPSPTSVGTLSELAFIIQTIEHLAVNQAVLRPSMEACGRPGRGLRCVSRSAAAAWAAWRLVADLGSAGKRRRSGGAAVSGR